MNKIFFSAIFSMLIGINAHASVFTGADSLIKTPETLKGKRYAVCMNRTSRLADGTLLVDSLIGMGLIPAYIFSPEHGFPETAGAGEKVKNTHYQNIPVISLYGKSKTPPDSIMERLDLVIYDIQDVGLRFYTYISTLKNIALACRKNDKELWVLDRPDPLGGEIVEGPILKDEFSSFVGSWPVPIRYGLTPGELMKMGMGEGWIPEIKLRVFPLRGWRRDANFSAWKRPWISPSPNLPSFENLKAYSGLCLLEGTVISEGRGTDSPFMIFGYPDSAVWEADIEADNPDLEKVRFTPRSVAASRYPKYRDQLCYGFRITSGVRLRGMLNKAVYWISEMYDALKNKDENFFISSSTGRYFIDLLYGGPELREYIIQGKNLDNLIEKNGKESRRFRQKSGQYFLYR